MSGPWDEFQRVDSAPPRTAAPSNPGPRVIVADPSAGRDIARDQRDAAASGRDAVRTDIAVDSAARDSATTDIKNPQALRTEFSGSPEAVVYNTLLPAYATAIATRNDGMGDLNALYAYVKALDAIGAVRGEDVDNIRATVPSLQGIATRLGFQLGENGLLSPADRTRMFREFHNRVVQANTAYTARRGFYEQLAGRNGIDPFEVVGPHPGNAFNQQIRTFLSQNPEASSIPIRRPNPSNPNDFLTPDDFITGAESVTRGDSNQGLPRMTPEQEAAWSGFVQANAGRMTPEMIQQWVAQNGNGWRIDLSSPDAQKWIDALNRGERVSSGVNYSQADAQYQSAMDAELARRETERQALAGQFGGDLTRFIPGLSSQEYGDAASRTQHGMSQAFIDELNGAGAALFGAQNNPGTVSDYEWERDLTRRNQEQAQGRMGMMGTVADVAGSAMTAGFIPGAGVARSGMTAADIARAGGVAGATYGFGSGEGARNSALSALVTGSLGYAGGQLFGKAGEALAARAPSAAAGERQAFIEAATRNPEIPIIPADITGSTGAQVATGLAERSFAGGMITNARDRGAEALGGLADDVASRVGTVGDNVAAGDAAIAGANRYVTDSQTRVGRLYDAIPITGTTNAELTKTRAAFGEISTRYASNPELQAAMRDPQMSRWQQAIANGGLSWDDLKAFRTDVGEIIAGPVLSEGGSRSRMRALYGALTADMEATARAQGGPAIAAFKAANRAAAERFSNIDRVITPVLGNDGLRGAEAAFARINSWAAARGGDHVRLARFMRSIPADDANTIRATIVSRLGEATPGANNVAGDAFSPSTFLSNWNRMSERARSVLFDGPHRQAIDDLAALAGGMKQGKRFANNSETSRGSMLLATLGLTYANPAAGVASAAGQTVSSALLASPRVARWMVALANKPNQAAVNAHVQRLGAIARAEPALAADIMSLQQRLNQAFAQPSYAAAAQGQEQPNVR